jgi:hypothetical protein
MKLRIYSLILHMALNLEQLQFQLGPGIKKAKEELGKMMLRVEDKK